MLNTIFILMVFNKKDKKTTIISTKRQIDKLNNNSQKTGTMKNNNLWNIINEFHNTIKGEQ